VDQEELMMHRPRIFGFAICVALCVAEVALAADGSATAEPGLANPFFAFDDGTGYGRVSAEDQAAMLKELGYGGIGYTGAQRIPEMLRALDARRLTMFSIYVEVCLKPEKGKPLYDPALETAIQQLKGRPTQIWLPIGGGRPSSTEVDDRAVAVIREVADMAAASGLRVVLYPHEGLYVQRLEDGLRLVKKASRKNVGVAFNLCHFLKVEGEKHLEQRLKVAKPCLFAVSINGADGGETGRMGWDRLIQTLDRGSFDVGRVLGALEQLGYAGPIGLQCYGIPGDNRENLKRSMKAWRNLRVRAATRKGP
jgi:sugar phosphate isomerase/epimerase